MKPRPSFWLRPQRPYRILSVGSKTNQLAVELTEFAAAGVFFGLPVLVFQLAGGDWSDITDWINRIADDHVTPLPQPLVIAAVVMLGMQLMWSMSGTAGRLWEMRRAGQWFAKIHPEDTPRPEVIEAVQEILRTDGPLFPFEIRDRVNSGGPWGGPLRASVLGIAQVLMPYGKPAKWLGEWQPGWPYSVPENQYVPESAKVVDQVVAEAVRLHGPIYFHSLAQLLAGGGEHGAPLVITDWQLHRLLRKATWLAPRLVMTPYVHRSTAAADDAGEVLEEATPYHGKM